MKKYIIILFLFVSCRNPVETNKTFDQSFEIAMEHSMELPDGSIIEFVNVNNDSRCPTGAMCVWEGKADISLALQKTGMRKEYFNCSIFGYVFKSNTARHISVNILDYKITVLQLDPYPVVNTVILKQNYSVIVKITKL